MKYYVYTIPKSGTYLMATVLEMLGIRDSGWHVSDHRYLNTKAYTNNQNMTEPRITVKEQLYVRTLDLLPDHSLCFGHLAPIFFPRFLQKKIKVIAVWRDLKEILVSEFIDFRFRRMDIGWLSKEAIPSDQEAFHAYMQNRSPDILDHANEFLAARSLFNNKNFVDVCGSERYFELNFSSFLSNNGLNELGEIAKFVNSPLTEGGVKLAYQQSLEAENKTKATDVQLDFRREELWDNTALAIYNDSGFDALNQELAGK